jgi:pimeloyl-ACP methyl ester carboxylesterase
MIRALARAPSRVVGLWLMGCSPGPHGDPTTARLRNDRVQREEFDAVVEELATTIAYEGGPYGAAQRAVSGAWRGWRARVFLRQNTALLSRLDRRADLARVGCPSLVVWGREDRFASVQHGAEMSALIPGARFVVLDGCGHLPTLERPDATIGLAREWLGRIGVNARTQR